MIARVIAALIIYGVLAVIIHSKVKGLGVADNWRFRSTLTLMGAGVITCLAGVCLVGVAHEAGWIARSTQPLWMENRNAYKRISSKNNMKQIGLGLLNYHDVSIRYPSGGSFDGSGRAIHGWMTLILPYTDRPDLAKKVNWDLPWNDPTQRDVFSETVPGYQYFDANPRAIDGYSTATYAANKLVMGGNLSYSIREITDGASNTLFAAEVIQKLKPWGHPVNYRDMKLGINQSPGGFGGPFIGGVNALLMDGSVRFLSEKTDPGVLQAIATPTGSEPLGDF